jgi:hypothetical protein
MAQVNFFNKRGVRAVYALFVTSLSILIVNSYEFGVHDHWYMLPWIKNLQDGSLFSIDLITNQRQYHYSILYPLLAYSPLSLAASFFIIYVLCLASLFYMAMATHKLFSSQWLYLTPLFLVLPWYTPGGTFTIASHLLMRTAGLPLLLVSLYFHLKEKHLFAWLILGLAFWVHPTTALYLATFFGLELLISSRRRLLKNWLAILPFILLCLPIFYKKFNAPETGFPGFWADDYWLETIRIRSAHHAFPDSWHRSHILSAAAMLALLFMFAVLEPVKKLKQFFTATLLGFTLIVSAGLIFTYWLPAFSAIQIQPFRVVRLVMIFTLLFTPIFFSKIQFKGKQKIAIGFCLLVLCFAGQQQSKLHFFYFFAFSGLIVLLFLWPKQSKRISFLALVPLFILLANKPIEKLIIQEPEPLKTQAELYSWVQKNSSAQSLWVVPAKLLYFRNYTQRNVYVAWYDGTFGYFDYNYNSLWRQRYTKVYGVFDYDANEPLFEKAEWPMDALIKNNPAYLVKTKPLASQENLLWQNEHYFIYRL